MLISFKKHDESGIPLHYVLSDLAETLTRFALQHGNTAIRSAQYFVPENKAGEVLNKAQFYGSTA